MSGLIELTYRFYTPGVTKEDGMYPNTEKACRQYYACADGEMIRLKMCDEGTVFDIQRWVAAS